MGALIDASVLGLVENTPDGVVAQLAFAIGVSLLPLHSGILLGALAHRRGLGASMFLAPIRANDGGVEV